MDKLVFDIVIMVMLERVWLGQVRLTIMMMFIHVPCFDSTAKSTTKAPAVAATKGPTKSLNF